MRLEFAEEIRPIVESQNMLEIPVNLVSGAIARETYLNRGFGNSYNFRQTP